MAKDSEDKKQASDLPDSNESGKGTSLPSKLADADEAKVKILLLVKDLNHFHSVKSFLIRRGWPTEVLSSFNKAISYLSEEEPDYIAISMNFNHPNLSKLPVLIEQTFHCVPIVFAETNDHITMGKLNTINTKYKEMGPISGPSLHRKIKMIMTDQYEEVTPVKKQAEKATGPDYIKFKNDSKPVSSSEKVEMSFGSMGNDSKPGPKTSAAKQQAIDRLQREMLTDSSPDDEGGFDLTEKGATLPQTGGVHIQKGEQLTPSAGTAGEQVKADNPSESAQLHQGEGAASSMQMSKGQFTKDSANMISGEAIASGSVVAKGQAPEDLGATVAHGQKGSGSGAVVEKGSSATNVGSMIEQGAQPEQNSELQSQEAAESGSVVAKGAASESNLAHQRGQDPVSSRVSGTSNGEATALLGDGSLDPTVEEKKFSEKNNLDTESHFLFEASKLALSKVTNYALEPVASLNKSEDMIAIPMRSGGLSGYMLLTHGDKERVNKELARAFLDALRGELEKMGKDLDVLGSLKVNVSPIDFKQFTSEFGEFNYSTTCGRHEASVGFVTGPPAMVPTVLEKENQSKLGIEVNDLSCEKEVSFPAYIHLEKNNRYFLYLKQGSKIIPDQKDRMIGKQVDLYIDPNDIEKFKEYVVGNILDDMFTAALADEENPPSAKKKVS